MNVTISESDGHWLAGLVDGEGCFALWTRRRKVGHSDDCRCVSFVFKISLRSDDQPILEELRKLLKMGTITVNRRAAHQEGRYVYNGRVVGGAPLSSWVVQDKQDLLRLVAVFRRFPLRTKKRRDFEVWSEALERFVQYTIDAPRVWEARTDAPQVRPMRGSVRQRFKKIPDEIYVEMQRFEQAIKAGRVYEAA